MKIESIRTRPVVVTLAKPIGSALGQIHSLGCVLVFVRDESGMEGENLVFTLKDRRPGVLRQVIDELGGLLIGALNRATSSRVDLSGKGVNVSMALREFGLESIMTGFVAGQSGRVLVEGLRAAGSARAGT